MRRTKVSFLLLFAFFISSPTMCDLMRVSAAEQQNHWKISGAVTDQSGQPLIGATVIVKNSGKGTSADLQGRFSIDVSQGDVLRFQYVGYKPQEITVAKQTLLNVSMQEETTVLEEVAVTALGIKRERKALGYSMGEVKGEELEKAKETNVINSLAGKVPGLVISQTAGGPSGSSRVIIRGSTELTGNNQPLYVVDGIPLDNTNYGAADHNGGYDLGDGISAVNPDDIESISVLKGPAASALYGSRASHGVILITTKKADGKKRVGVEFNSTTTIERQLTKYNDLQTTYGQGTRGRISGVDDRHSSSKNWGPKIDEGLYLTYFDGQVRPYKFIEDNIDGFFRTGLTTTNTLVLNASGEKTGMRASYTNMYNRDIVPNSDMQRNTFNLRANSTFIDKIDVDFKVNYVREDVNNRPALSGDRANVGKNLITLATTFDQRWLRDSYKNRDGKYYDWNNNDVYNLNPYWIVNEMQNTSVKDRFSGSASANYRINDKLQARVTGGGEINMFTFEDYAPRSTPGKETGYMQLSNFKNYTYNIEALVSFRDKICDFEYGASVGGNIYHVNNNTEIITAKDMRSDAISLTSFMSKEIVPYPYKKQINSVFGLVNLSYGGYVFVDATLRGDKSSTLASGNNTYWYPSVSGSFVFTEVLDINKNMLPFGKIRASFAQVGSDTDPYQLELTYSMLAKVYGDYALGQIYNSVIPNGGLKPTKTNSAEFGVELKFLKNRLGLDVTYYTQSSTNQIMRPRTTISSGYNSAIINAGEIQNKGIEVMLTTRPVQTKDWTWNLNFNFSKNSNKVVKLTDEINQQILAEAAWLDVTVQAVAGQNYGAITGRDFKRNAAGQIIVDGNTGLPEVSDDIVVLGNSTWDWTGGMTTNLRYKSFSLSAIFDVKVGADIYSMTARSFHNTGKSSSTLGGRDAWYRSEEQRLASGATQAAWTPTGGYLVQGVVESTDAYGNKTYTPNSRYVDPEDYWSHVSTKVPSVFVYDNSYVKVREITFSYTFPQKLVQKWADAASLSFVARNPFIIYRNVDNIDPDSNYNNSSGMGLEYGSLPSRRSFGVNLHVKF